jgi:type IV pilus assembly protein PilB
MKKNETDNKSKDTNKSLDKDSNIEDLMEDETVEEIEEPVIEETVEEIEEPVIEETVEEIEEPVEELSMEELMKMAEEETASEDAKMDLSKNSEEEEEEKSLSQMSIEELMAQSEEILADAENKKEKTTEEMNKLISLDKSKNKVFIPNPNNYLLRNLLEFKGLEYDETIMEAKKIGKPIIEFLILKNYLNPSEILEFFHEETGINTINNLIDLTIVEEKTFYKRYQEKKIVIYYPFAELITSLETRFPEYEILITTLDLFEIKSTNEDEEEGLKTEFEKIIKEALRLNVSDIHFEVKEYGLEIKMRIMGEMRIMDTISLNKANSLQKYIKDVAAKYTKASNYDTETWEARQDARIELPDFKIDLRLALTPSLVDGLQNNVMRILKTEGSVKMEEAKAVMVSMGYLEEDVVEFQKWIEKPKGIILVTGSTGSGKSKMLNTLIAAVSNKHKIVTAEDPVEYKIPAATQHQVFRKELQDKVIDMSFLEYIRAFMRQDPDIIFIGEWRKEKELTEAIVYASNTGHLVLTSLHASSNAVITGLLVNDYGLQTTDVANNAVGFINQKLIKKICRDCKLEGVVTEEMILELEGEVHKQDYKDIMRKELLGKTVSLKGEGCDRCIMKNSKDEIISSGYEGRMATYEWLFVDEPMQDQILKSSSIIDMNNLIKKKSEEGTAKRYIDVLLYKILNRHIDFLELKSFLKGI